MVYNGMLYRGLQVCCPPVRYGELFDLSRTCFLGSSALGSSMYRLCISLGLVLGCMDFVIANLRAWILSEIH